VGPLLQVCRASMPGLLPPLAPHLVAQHHPFEAVEQGGGLLDAQVCCRAAAIVAVQRGRVAALRAACQPATGLRVIWLLRRARRSAAGRAAARPARLAPRRMRRAAWDRSAGRLIVQHAWPDPGARSRRSSTSCGTRDIARRLAAGADLAPGLLFTAKSARPAAARPSRHQSTHPSSVRCAFGGTACCPAPTCSRSAPGSRRGSAAPPRQVVDKANAAHGYCAPPRPAGGCPVAACGPRSGPRGPGAGHRTGEGRAAARSRAPSTRSSGCSCMISS